MISESYLQLRFISVHRPMELDHAIDIDFWDLETRYLRHTARKFAANVLEFDLLVNRARLARE